MQCWIISTGDHLDWLFALYHHPNWRVTQLFLRGPCDPALISALAPSLAVSPWPPSGPFIGAVPDMVLLGIRVDRGILDLLHAYDIPQVLTSVGVRRLSPPWKRHTLSIAHDQWGGVTATKSTFVALSSHQTPSVRAHLSPPVPRDLSTVLSYGESCDSYCCTPSPEFFSTPVVATVSSPGACPAYHGRGLLPTWDSATRVMVATPSRYCRKGYWGIRPLTPLETLQVLDAGDALARVLLLHSARPTLPLALFRTALDVIAPAPAPAPASPATLPSLKAVGPGSVAPPPAVVSPSPAGTFHGGGSFSTFSEAASASLAANREAHDRKATKSDSAPIPYYLWEDHLRLGGLATWHSTTAPGLPRAMDIMRHYCLKWWKRKLRRCFLGWYRSRYPSKVERADKVWTLSSPVLWNSGRGRYQWSRSPTRSQDAYAHWFNRRYRSSPGAPDSWVDYTAAHDAITRASYSTWWDWSRGSRPFFWRWPSEAFLLARDGMEVYFINDPPSYTHPQPKNRDPVSKKLTETKLQKVIDQGYMGNDTPISSLTSYFHVPKGDDDIRMVYDGTKCGLNDAVWVPSFGMPSINSHLRAVVEGTWMTDTDLRDMFLNFMLHPGLKALCGVDLSPYKLDYSDSPQTPSLGQQANQHWLHWMRTAMGLKWSPYQAIKSMHFAEELIRGDHTDPNNVFRWDRILVNLPGSPAYDPTYPWLCKVKDDPETGRILVAADLFTFVDDLRPTGSTKSEAWQAGRRAASITNWLGVQDAPRKRRDSRQDPGAWAGCVLNTVSGVFALVSEDKWIKMKSLLGELSDLIESSPQALPRKRLEQIRGFLNYVVQTYKPMVPYLNGLHMTIDGWRPNRDADGWKLPSAPVWTSAHGPDSFHPDHPPETHPDAPTTVQVKPRLVDDVKALLSLCSSTHPPFRRVRPSSTATLMYGFVDASGPAFGASHQRAGSSDIHYHYGQWTSSVSSEESSNWRELGNLVFYLEGLEPKGELVDTEVFMFTDNSTAEAAFWKGTSQSRKLCDLILRLRQLEMRTGMILHVTHVSGKRMIAQGTDGLSRGDHSTGSMAGSSISSFIPLHLSPFHRSETLLPWIEDVLQDSAPMVLSYDNWFDSALNQNGTFVWNAAPASAEFVVERLSVARHKRPNSLHLIAVPRLMTGRWRKHLTRRCDFYFKVDNDFLWNLRTHHEPLLIFVCLPFLPHRPQLSARESIIGRLRGALLSENVRQIHTASQRAFLRQLFCETRQVSPL